jgi:hypothetical protein
MARQTLNRGTTANDGTGDTLRTAAQKINENFSELYLTLGGDGVVTSVTLVESGVSFEGLTEDAFELILGLDSEPSSDLKLLLPVAARNNDTITLNETAQILARKTLEAPIITDNFSIADNTGDHSYAVIAEELSTNVEIGLPVLSTDDVFVFANATQTLTNKTIDGLNLNNPTLGGIANGSTFFDSSSNEYIQFSKTAAAVNYITLANAATGNAPTIDVDGDDTNVSLNLASKGTGGITFKNKLVLEKGTDVVSNTAVDLTEPLTVFNSGSLISPTIGDGTTQGETKYFINVNTGEARLTPSGASTNIFSVDSGNGFISFDEGDGCQLIWNSTNSLWYIVASNGVTTG